MEWKAEEDIICCEVCVYEYVIKKNDTEIKTCIETIKKHASICRRGEGSIKNRIQNIKFWLDELYIENNIPVTPQGKRIIDSAMHKADIFRFLNRVSVCCLL